MTLARISAGTERCGDPTPQPRQAGRAEPEDPEQKCLHLRHVYAAGDTLTVPLWRENGSFKTIWAAHASDAGLYLCSDIPLWGSGPGHRGRLRVTSLSVINFSVIDLSSVAGKPETPADRLWNTTDPSGRQHHTGNQLNDRWTDLGGQTTSRPFRTEERTTHVP